MICLVRGTCCGRKTIDPSHKSLNATSPYPTMDHSEEKSTHFLFWMLHCGIWDRCIMGFMNLVYGVLICESLNIMAGILRRTQIQILYCINNLLHIEVHSLEVKKFLWFHRYWNLFLGIQLTVSQHWFRLWLAAIQMTSHCYHQGSVLTPKRLGHFKKNVISFRNVVVHHKYDIFM